MNRRNRTLIVLLVAVSLASAATFLVYRGLAGYPSGRSKSPRSRWRWPRRTFPPALG